MSRLNSVFTRGVTKGEGVWEYIGLAVRKEDTIVVRGNLWDPVIGFRNQLFCFFPTSMSKNEGNCVGYPSRKFGEKFLRALEENSCFQRTYPLKYCCNFPVFGRINPSKVWISSKAIQKISPTFGEGYPTSFLLFWCIFVGKTIKKWFPKMTTSSQIFPLTTANPFSQSYAGKHTRTHANACTYLSDISITEWRWKWMRKKCVW